MLTLILQANVTQRIEAALEKAGRHEIGGVLMAEHLGDDVFTITDLTVHKRGTLASFVRRIEDALTSLTSFFVRTNHDYTKFNYIGEWHSHPSFELEPSPKDDASMIEIVLDPNVGAKFAVLLLVKLNMEKGLLANAHLYLPDSTRRRCNLTYASSLAAGHVGG
jgi:JAB domain-containing protein similar to deubiquitination enzymes